MVAPTMAHLWGMSGILLGKKIMPNPRPSRTHGVFRPYPKDYHGLVRGEWYRK